MAPWMTILLYQQVVKLQVYAFREGIYIGHLIPSRDFSMPGRAPQPSGLSGVLAVVGAAWKPEGSHGVEAGAGSQVAGTEEV